MLRAMARWRASLPFRVAGPRVAALVPATILPGVVSLIGLSLIGHFAGAALVGEVSLAVVTANCLSAFVSLGPAYAVVRLVNTGHREQIPRVRSVVLRRGLLTGAFVGVPTAAFAVLSGQALPSTAAWGAALGVVQSVVLFEAEALKADSRFARASLLLSLRATAGWTASVIAVRAGGGLAAAVLASLVVGSGVVLAIAPALKLGRPDERSRHELRRTGRPLAALLLASYALGYADRYIVQGMLGSASVGLYSIGYQLGEGLGDMTSAPITGVLQPRLVSEWHTPGGPHLARRTALKGLAAIATGSVVMAGALVLSAHVGLLDLLFKSSALLPIAELALLGTVFNAACRLAGGLLLAQGRTSSSVRWAWMTTFVGVGLVPPLTLWHGTVGAAVATPIGYAILAVCFLHEVRRGRLVPEAARNGAPQVPG